MRHKPGVAFLLAAALVPAVAAAKTPEQIFQQASQSVIVIHAYDGEGNPINQGGGVVTGRELVTTNCHVIEGAASIEVQYPRPAAQARPCPGRPVRKEIREALIEPVSRIAAESHGMTRTIN
jgi:S1-C subfamily serine protease